MQSISKNKNGNKRKSFASQIVLGLAARGAVQEGRDQTFFWRTFQGKEKGRRLLLRLQRTSLFFPFPKTRTDRSMHRLSRSTHASLLANQIIERSFRCRAWKQKIEAWFQENEKEENECSTPEETRRRNRRIQGLNRRSLEGDSGTYL